METGDWCWLCQTHHEPVDLSARFDAGGWGGLLDELRRFILNAPVTRRRSAMRTEYRRRTRTRTRSRRR